MVHVFTELGLTLALDVESGALHCVDELTARLIPVYESGFTGVLSNEEHEAWEELAALEKAGQLFTPEMSSEAQASRHTTVIKALCLHAAHDCDLRCGYCFAHFGDFGGGRGLMPAEVGMHALDFLIKHSGNRRHLEVDFFGGEPMLNWEAVKQIVAYGRGLERAQGKEIAFTMTTNAYTLPPDAVEFANREFANLVVSVDGRKQTHDRMRPAVDGRGSYERVITNIKALTKNRQKDWYARGTFTRNNLDFVEDVKALLNEGLVNLSLEPVSGAGKAFHLREEDMPIIENEYENLAQHYLNNSYTFFHFLADMTGGPCVHKRLLGCGAGVEYAAVTPDGSLYPCHQFAGQAQWRMGSVLDGTFDENIRTKMAANNINSKEACRGCWAKYHCAGGCAAAAFFQNGAIDRPDELACRMQKKRLQLALAIYAKQY
ncbi:MAG: thioether cross-link-forming SCIFF peptide maturase [Clostridia bacterium]|nr:thioether cross-link-forming SCIFF peptide maturase [Clostridia bacterium]